MKVLEDVLVLVQMVKVVLQVVAARAKEMQVIVMKIVEDALLAMQILKMALVFALTLIPLQTSTRRLHGSVTSAV